MPRRHVDNDSFVIFVYDFIESCAHYRVMLANHEVGVHILAECYEILSTEFHMLTMGKVLSQGKRFSELGLR